MRKCADHPTEESPFSAGRQEHRPFQEREIRSVFSRPDGVRD